MASVNLMQLAPTAAVLCEIMCNDGHWAVHASFKVTDFGTNRRPICDLLLANNTDFGHIIAFNRRIPELWTAKSGLKTTNITVSCGVQHYRRTDRRTELR